MRTRPNAKRIRTPTELHPRSQATPCSETRESRVVTPTTPQGAQGSSDIRHETRMKHHSAGHTQTIPSGLPPPTAKQEVTATGTMPPNTSGVSKQYKRHETPRMPRNTAAHITTGAGPRHRYPAQDYVIDYHRAVATDFRRAYVIHLVQVQKDERHRTDTTAPPTEAGPLQ
ncbi:hypothetical protein H257_09538 [Aphanomyces astaci]|uniref:Uncharacterized protein n=1 Tax=Aphanomyces astaci TaxID=112090 RepID=W4GB79_APHAT|nr:hypothetical protein H257_09538 [Aphanomyces astaci]ETV76536.1 hypothetical protein H257_09538 [Aphanomyces astaci]|eukprot:XP_009834081.1 hypothetical protein H257_09538 [Aphanomyces astaci]